MLTDHDKDLYANDPIFRTWADSVTNFLIEGRIDLDRLRAATNVGITNYALRYKYRTCSHPKEARKTMPFGEICNACGRHLFVTDIDEEEYGEDGKDEDSPEYTKDNLLVSITPGTATCTHIALSLGISLHQVSRIATKYKIPAAGQAVYNIPEKGISHARSFDLKGWVAIRSAAESEGLISNAWMCNPPPSIR